MTVPLNRPRGTITEADYRSIWAPQGWKLLIIGPTTTWRQEWHTWEAVRDIVQNCLDESEAYIAEHDDLGLVIEDNGRGVAITDLLLGPAKAKPWYTRGRYGEGMKVAALALLREGYDVFIETVGRDIAVVFYEQPVNGHVNVLAAMWKPGGTTFGTRFHIIGYFGTAYDDRFAPNLPSSSIVSMAPTSGEFPIPRQTTMYKSNMLSSSGKPIGYIFVRDIFLMEIDSQYSYNLWDVALAPDRHVPEKSSAIDQEIGRVWACTTDLDVMNNIFRVLVEPEQLKSWERQRVSMSTWYLGDKSQEIFVSNRYLWETAFHRLFGTNAVLVQQSGLAQLIQYYGYKPVSLSYGFFDIFSKVLPVDMEILAKVGAKNREVEIIPDSALNPKQLNNLTFARTIAVQLSSETCEVHAARIPQPSPNTESLGLADTTLKHIYLSLSVLSRSTDCVKTIIHECAHINTNVGDTDPRHYEEIARLSAFMVEYVARGVFNEVLKEIDWY